MSTGSRNTSPTADDHPVPYTRRPRRIGPWRPAVSPRSRSSTWAHSTATALVNAALVDEIREICHEIGFFVVVNHGVDPALVSATFDMMRTFFALPEADKLRIDKRSSRHFRGWEPVGAESTNNRPDIREQIDLWTEWPPRAIDAQPPYLRLLGPNSGCPTRCCPGTRAPRMVPGARSARRPVLASSPRPRAGPRPPVQLLRRRADVAHEAHLLSAHAGRRRRGERPPRHGFLTVLPRHDAAGLQVENPDGEWIDVPWCRRLVRHQPRRDAPGDHRQLLRRHDPPGDHRRAALSAGYFHGPALDPRSIRSPSIPASPRRSPPARATATPASWPPGRDAAGLGDMRSRRPDTYGEQLWNYFARSYPDNMARHYPRAATKP